MAKINEQIQELSLIQQKLHTQMLEIDQAIKELRSLDMILEGLRTPDQTKHFILALLRNGLQRLREQSDDGTYELAKQEVFSTLVETTFELHEFEVMGDA